MERNDYEWKTICEYLIEQVAILKRDNIALKFVLEMKDETIENLKRKLDGAGVE